MRAALLAAVFAAGCSPWAFPPEPARLEAPAGLGVRLPMEGGVLRTFSAQLGASTTRAVLMVQEGPGYDRTLAAVSTVDTHWYGVDAATGTRTELPAPPLGLERFWPTLIPGEVFASSGQELLTLSAANVWSVLPQSPAPPTPATQLLRLADGRVLGHRGAALVVLVDGVWHDLSTPLGLTSAKMVFGPAGDGVVRLVWAAPGDLAFQVCTQRVDTRTTFAPVGEKTCKVVAHLPAEDFAGDAVNGTLDDFQVVFARRELPGAGTVWRFNDGAWHRGWSFGNSPAKATPFPVQGSAGAFLEVGGQVLAFSQGRGAGTVLSPPGTLLTQCRPPECRLKSSLSAIAPDLSGAWVLSVNEADAVRSVFLERWSAEAPSCTPGCKSTEFCVRVDATTTTCALDASLAGGPTGSPATVKASFTALQGPVFPKVTVTDVKSGTSAAATTTLEGTAEVIEVPELTAVRLTAALEGSGLPPLELAFTTQLDEVQADLGELHFFPGLPLGSSVGLPAVPGGDVLYQGVAGRDGGVALLALAAAVDGGVDATVVFEGPGLTGAQVSPDGGFVLLERGPTLEVLDRATGQRAAVASGSGEGWFGATFSRDGTAAAVSRLSGVSVVSLSGTAPAERFEVHGASGANPATAVQLSRDGSVLLARLPAGFVVVTGAGQVPLPVGLTDAVLSGDGTHVYLVDGSGGISVRPATSTATPTVVTAAATAYAADPDGSALLWTTATDATHQLVSRWDVGTASATPLGTFKGQGGAFAHAGALWVDDASTGNVRYWFPASLLTPRLISGLAPTSVDRLGRLQAANGSITQLIDEVSDQRLAKGPGVFRPDFSRRITRSGDTVYLETVSGGSVLTTTQLTVTGGLTLAPLFTRAKPMESLGAPCALFEVAARTASVAPASGVVTWSAAESDVRCAR